MENKREKGRKADIFLKAYVEYESSKIYTKVEENLLVIVLKGKKVVCFLPEKGVRCERRRCFEDTRGIYLSIRIGAGYAER